MARVLCLLLLTALTLDAEEPAASTPPWHTPERVATNALPPFTAIQAKGFIESTERGFRFPDGSVQTSAATVSGGVPSVNGVGSAVTIVGSGSTSVNTAAGTITVSTPALYKRTVVLGPVPNNPLASGTALRTALDGIAGATATNRYLLKVEPGVYDLGTNQLVMKTFVDLEGSGSGSTIILTNRGAGMDPQITSGVIAAGSSELRNIALTNQTDLGYGIALYASNVRNLRLTDVALRSRAQIAIGLYLIDSGVTAFRTTISAGEGFGSSAVGISVDGDSELTLSLSSVTTDGGGTLGSTTAIDITGASATTIVESSTLVAGGATNFSYGLRATGDAAVRNSVIVVETTPRRYAVATYATLSARLTVKNSDLIAGNSFSTNDVLSISKGSGSSLRVYGSYVDSAAGGSPVCVYNYGPTAPSSCPAPI